MIHCNNKWCKRKHRANALEDFSSEHFCKMLQKETRNLCWHQQWGNNWKWSPYNNMIKHFEALLNS